MATITRLSLTLDPMGISHFHLFFWNHNTDLNQTWQKCSLDGHIQVFVFGADQKSNMAARAHNVFWLVEILKIFLLETTKPIELWLCRNDHWGVVNCNHLCHVCFKLAYWFQRRRFLNIFPIGSYVKTMSADGGHLGWRSGSQDIILKVDHLRTIHAMFALNWLTEEDF
jgi:hypothetical protein